ncbi:MAG: RHS repeat-associated core domain-containing protein [Pirellulaceae bacterium]
MSTPATLTNQSCGTSPATESLYYHRNQQYSVTAATDGSGAIAERHAYSAYGVPTITNASGTLRSASTYDNRYLYTGREWDDVILMYHYRARMYDAELGRFCSKDPIGYEGSRWSVYEYVRGASTLIGPAWSADRATPSFAALIHGRTKSHMWAHF